MRRGRVQYYLNMLLALTVSLTLSDGAYSRNVSYLGQTIQRCFLTNVGMESKMELANSFDVMQVQ